MSDIDIDIIITCYNQGEYLRQAVDSALAQSRPCRPIIVDDGSDSECSGYLDQRQNVWVRHIRHSGQAAATNHGARIASNKYICRLDADDWLHPDFCLTLGAYLDHNPECGAVFCDYQPATEAGAIVAGQVVEQRAPPHGSCMLIRRSIFDELGGYDETLHTAEDYDFWHRLRQITRIHHIALPLWYYRQHPNQKSRAWNERQAIRHSIKEKHMKNAQKVLAVIPARGNSKGIPGKNLRLLGGVPLVSHAIRMAKRCQHDMLIAVSTEDPEIAEVARSEGVEVIDRPEELSRDEVSTIGPVKHAMQYMDVKGWMADIVVSIQATDPFTPPEALDAALTRIQDEQVDSVMAIAAIHGTHPWRAYMLQDGDRVDPLFPDLVERYQQRQDRPPAYGTTGGFYVRRRRLLEQWEGDGWALGTDCRGVIVPPHAAVDIDTRLDWLLAEAVLEHMGEV